MEDTPRTEKNEEKAKSGTKRGKRQKQTEKMVVENEIISFHIIENNFSVRT